jgi:hypothetical protein
MKRTSVVELSVDKNAEKLKLEKKDCGIPVR